jgi:ribokinase
MRRPLLVIGSLNADLYVEIVALPMPGTTIAGRECAVRSGGKGANQAAAAAKVGYPTRFAGRVGSDAFAPELRRDLRAAGVDERLLTAVPGPSGQAYILLQAGGENSIIVAPGANAQWGQTLDSSLCAAIAEAGAVLLQRESPEAITVLAAQAAQAAGVPVILDAGGSDNGPLPAALLACLSVCSPNESELARLTGMPTADDAQVLAAARQLQAQGVDTVLVKLGARGCLLVRAEATPMQQAAYPVAVVDTTGAGDCFTATYTVAMLEGMDEAERLRFACAAAAVCVQRKGALPSMPTADELRALQEREEYHV